jgi:hypothetical protein
MGSCIIVFLHTIMFYKGYQVSYSIVIFLSRCLYLIQKWLIKVVMLLMLVIILIVIVFPFEMLPVICENDLVESCKMTL